MNAREYLKGLSEHDPVWDMAEEYEYTEDQLINFAERYHEKQLKLLRIGGVSKSFNSEEELLQFIYMHTPIAIKPKSKRAKGQLVSAFKSGNAFEQVCKHLAKKLFNVC